jgi:hypothetical protein
VLVESFLFIVIVYPLVGLYGGVGSTFFLYTWCMLLMVDLVARSWVLFLSCISPTQEIASILVPISNVLFSVFSGYLAPANSIPVGWRWMYDISYYTSGNTHTALALRCSALPAPPSLRVSCLSACCQVRHPRSGHQRHLEPELLVSCGRAVPGD